MKTLSVRISEEEKEKLDQFAEENDLTISQIIRRALKEFLEKEQSK